MAQNEIDEQKKIEFYAASVAAWYESSLEHDKSLLTLSAGGIGLLITLLTTVGLGSPPYDSDDSFRSLVERIEFLISKENTAWARIPLRCNRTTCLRHSCNRSNV